MKNNNEHFIKNGNFQKLTLIKHNENEYLFA